MCVLKFDCRFHYPAGFALDFAFTAPRGVTAVVGPSGCGKTTVLNLIAGLLTPDSGAILLDGEPLFDSRAKKNLPPERRGVGYVFQDYQLFPHLTVAANLRYGARRAAGDRLNYDQVAAMLELAPLLQRRPSHLSGGQRQRVAIGRALLRRPRLLLLDEPLNALDEELRRNLVPMLARVVDEAQLPTLLVSHDRSSVASLAATVVAM